MKLPRDISGQELAKALAKLGYRVTRQRSSHIRLTTQQNGEHHTTIPDHNPVKIGTLSGILSDVAEHFGITRDELLTRLFG
jgi:predicted RNA binding protein YcfA (HicA-like mRNA interferase family)